MDEIISDTIDATQPALITLQELSAITVAREIWRCEMNYYRTNDELEKFNPKKLRISLKTTFPDLPTVINNKIEKYFSKFRRSMENWLEEHYKRVFFSHYLHQNYILEDFNDFVCDYGNGTIDYLKTAERMMRCDRLSKSKKFKIACTYFFEDDIRRIWPSVCKKIGLNNFNFDDCPQLYYWICCLRNELNKIPTSWNQTVDETMFNRHMSSNGPSLEYFWKRVPYENHIHKAIQLYLNDEKETLVRYILPLFDDHQLGEFVNVYAGWGVMSDLLLKPSYDETLALQTWMRMKNIIKEDDFTELVLKICKYGPSTHNVKVENHDDKISSLLCDEIWYSAPQDLRRSAIKNILSSKFDRQFEHSVVTYRDHSADLLFTILTCATFEERYSFWHYRWHNIIFRRSLRDLQRIMEMCFENDDAIIQYKQNVMVTSERVQHHCKELIRNLNFKELDELVDFCCPNKDPAKLFKQQLLQFSFLRKKPVLSENHLSKANELDKFINDTYNNTDLARNLKNHVLSLPVIRWFKPPRCSIPRPCSVQLNEFMKFVETFVSTQRKLKRIKMLVIDHWKKNGYFDSYHYDVHRECSSSIDQFLWWCLGNDEEVEKFKQTYVKCFIYRS
ncbi:uncharacterized protein LOC135848258 isoform X2 [Planococcus citri]|uniref:uncharacterized protein LOC135848258 isoform X2 n=1 Tax=Planococcus citri TaxID=170843 RepID=UPI0031F825D1